MPLESAGITVEFYVPTIDNEENDLSAEFNNFRGMLFNTFGGITEKPDVQGLWIDDARVYSDENHVIETTSKHWTPRLIEEYSKYLQTGKRTFIMKRKYKMIYLWAIIFILCVAAMVSTEFSRY
jgi:hypothetical protein